MKKIRIAITMNVLTTYREGFYERLFAREDMFVKVYCQDHVPGMNYKTIHQKYPDNVHLVKFWSAKNDKFAWQFLPWSELLNDYDVVFISGNPRVLSDAIFGTFLRIFKRKVVLWTMAHTYGANPITEKLRLFWSRIFNLIFVYTDSEVDYLVNKGFKHQIIVGMNNGLDQKKIDEAASMWSDDKLTVWRKDHKLETSIILISCARLDPKNKFDQMLRALPAIIENVPNVKWCLIGGGVEKEQLQELAKELGVCNHVYFVGELYQEFELAPWFLSAKLFIHPAAIGLSIMHAFGYGLPLVTHGSATLHGPEYAAFENGLTGVNFKINNVSQLSEAVIQLLKNEKRRRSMSEYVLKIAREKYNVDVMADRFVEIAKAALEDNKKTVGL